MSDNDSSSENERDAAERFSHVITTSSSRYWHHPDPEDPDEPKCGGTREDTLWRRRDATRHVRTVECSHCAKIGREWVESVECPECEQPFTQKSSYIQHYKKKHLKAGHVNLAKLNPEDLGLSPIGDRQPSAPDASEGGDA
jgi:uncharacterized C2H2 Zn-finger protein